MLAHERLEGWRSAHRLALEVFNLSQLWPKREMYGLTAQARRVALSVPANIAEGAARRGRKEFSRHLNIALGSLAELHYLLRFAHDFGICSPADWEGLETLRDRTGRLVFGLYRKVRPPANRPPA